MRRRRKQRVTNQNNVYKMNDKTSIGNDSKETYIAYKGYLWSAMIYIVLKRTANKNSTLLIALRSFSYTTYSFLADSNKFMA